ncbi:MAG TPA: glycosyltransferase family 4 protein [Solirubrobacteraceae bacterium]|nr:glycosyltransferase family 4 protein [Solirubrobacteraceae bacterium]
MRAHVVDPSAYTPPYDHALCSALAAEGVEVTLYTSRFAYGAVPVPRGYSRDERFYRIAARARSPRLRRAIKLAEHVPDMLAYRRAARSAQIVHFQWLAVQQLDGPLLPHGRPLVLTAHDILPREPRPGQRRAQQRLYRRFDAVIAHSRHGALRLEHELGVDPARVHVIPHGAFEHLAAADRPEPPPGAAEGPPVVLCFGLMRPYKGIDVLLDAWGQGLDGAELWIVGMARMDTSPLRARAPASVRFDERFVADAELPSLFARAQLVVLPYREAEASGVLFTALAFGRPMVLSDVGAFPELAATGAARVFPAGRPEALREALRELLADAAARERMSRSALAAARGPYSWRAVARQTIELYASLLR